MRFMSIPLFYPPVVNRAGIIQNLLKDAAKSEHVGEEEEEGWFHAVVGAGVTRMMGGSCHSKHQQAAELRQKKGHVEAMG